MQCLWDVSPQIGRETAEYLRENVGWSRSTVLTMLRRMTEKGLVRCGTESEIYVYSPLVKREDAVMKATHDFLYRVYEGSVSMMMSNLIKKENLSERNPRALHNFA